MKILDLKNPWKLDWAWVFVFTALGGIFFMRSGYKRHEEHLPRPKYFFWQEDEYPDGYGPRKTHAMSVD